MKKRTFNRAAWICPALPALALIMVSCLPQPAADKGGLNLTVYGFSIMKESLEKSVYPGFAAKWKLEHGSDVYFTSSFAGSETASHTLSSCMATETRGTETVLRCHSERSEDTRI